MTQNKPIFRNTIFLTKGVMKFSILLLSNKKPIMFTQLIQIITTASETSSLSMVSSYTILILNIENNFNNNFKWSSGNSILSSACNIINQKRKHFMSSIILLVQNSWLSCRSIYFFFDVILYFLSSFFMYASVSRLSLHYLINAGWYNLFIYGFIYCPKIYLKEYILSLYYVDENYVWKQEHMVILFKISSA